MHTHRVPSLQDALAEIPDFPQPQGKPYALVPALVLCCGAIMCGDTAHAALAQWGANYGPKWRKKLGLGGARRPTQPTLQRRCKASAAQQVAPAMSNWAQAVVRVGAPAAARVQGLALEGTSRRGAQQPGAGAAHLRSVCSHRLGVVLAQVAVAD